MPKKVIKTAVFVKKTAVFMVAGVGLEPHDLRVMSCGRRRFPNISGAL